MYKGLEKKYLYNCSHKIKINYSTFQSSLKIKPINANKSSLMKWLIAFMVQTWIGNIQLNWAQPGLMNFSQFYRESGASSIRGWLSCVSDHGLEIHDDENSLSNI